jgi:hypothetical protein
MVAGGGAKLGELLTEHCDLHIALGQGLSEPV